MVRLGFIVVLVALIGLLVSGLVALRVYEQEIAIEEAALSRAIETHGRRVQERLSERELLTRVAVGLIRSAHSHCIRTPCSRCGLRSTLSRPTSCWRHGSRISRPADVAKAEQILAEGGYSRPTIRNVDDTPVGGNLPAAFNVLMDVEPRTPETLASARADSRPGADIGPALAAALARRARRPHRTRRCCREPTATPASCWQRRSSQRMAGRSTGFITFSYRLGPLMLGNDEPSLFNVTLRDPRNESLEFSADRNGIVGAADRRAGRARRRRCCRASTSAAATSC